jgi:hypothetical protein
MVMNERIVELIKQSGTDVSGKWMSMYQVEKFAELIIRDCMHDCLRMQLGKQYTPEELLFQTKYRKIIKEHFGVKNEGFWSKE